MSDFWKENGLIKPTEIIVCAANMNDKGVIICGARHWDSAMRAQAEFIPSNGPHEHWKQGFINQFGEFRNRKDALAIVKSNGQPFNQDRNSATDELYSEGLY